MPGTSLARNLPRSYSSDGLATAVVNWTSDEYAAKANGSENEALVASRLISDPELRRLLTGEQGREWLLDRALRDASVRFLVNQQRFSPLDTAEVQDRYDAFISFSNEDRREVLLLVDALTKAGASASFTQVLRHRLDVSKTWCTASVELMMVMSQSEL